jgi:protein-tyrosine phosphatase
MKSLLFVCTANRFRSVIAEASLKALANQNEESKHWKITSAGTWAIEGLPPLPQAIRVAEKLGLEVERHLSREVSESILNDSSMILVMTESQREALILDFHQDEQKIRLLSQVFAGEDYDIPDPYDKVDDTPEEIGREINTLINSGFKRFVQIVNEMEPV